MGDMSMETVVKYIEQGRDEALLIPLIVIWFSSVSLVKELLIIFFGDTIGFSKSIGF